jgi:isopenicillin-N epimerase
MTPCNTLPKPAPIFDQFVIDPDVVYLNHGSFGACPQAILDAQSTHRMAAERELVRFYLHDAWGKLDRSRDALASLVGCRSRDLVFVHNATTGVATVLDNLDLNPGDELILTKFEYAACINNFKRTAERTGTKVVEAEFPWPIKSEDQVVEAIMSKVTDRTRFVLLSLITSSTGVRLPIERLIAQLKERGVETILDAAHGCGCVPMDIDGWGAAYTTGNAHKWLCAPKGAAFLHVRSDLQECFTPLIVSIDGGRLEAAAERSGRSPFNHAFDYVGTDDISAYLTIADAIQWLETTMDGGINGLMNRNRELCIKARDVICGELGITPPVPDAMLGPLSSIDLSSGDLTASQIKDRLESEFHIQIPVWDTPAEAVAVRISPQAYNSIEQYEYLARSLKIILQG